MCGIIIEWLSWHDLHVSLLREVAVKGLFLKIGLHYGLSLLMDLSFLVHLAVTKAVNCLMRC